jgi:Lecithin:cholesterol acyltransferase
MKKVVLGIHGLGNKPPKNLLTKWWKDALLEGLNTQGIKKELPIFEMIYWADILHSKPLNFYEDDKESPYYLDEPYTKAPDNFIIEEHSFRMKIVDFISDQLNKILLNDDKSLNYGFITDYILKKYFADLEAYYLEECINDFGVLCKAKDLIRKRIVETIEKYEGYEIMLIAHSMGSIISFDVLNFIIPNIKINTFVTIGSPLGLPVVVSKIAAEQKEKSNKKSLMATPSNITKNWYNLADIMDKVAINYKLADDFSQNEAGVAPVDFLVHNDYEIEGDKNPHKSFGYLRTPEFTNILNDFIAEEKLNILQRLLQSMQQFFTRENRN